MEETQLTTLIDEIVGRLVGEETTGAISSKVIGEIESKYGEILSGNHPKYRKMSDRAGVDDGMMFTRYVRTIAHAALESQERHIMVTPKEIAQRRGMPQDELIVAGLDRVEGARKKALAEGLLDAGGALVEPEFSADLIPLLRNKVIVRQAGARQVPMMSSSLVLPRVTGGGVAYYVGENKKGTPSQQTTGQLNFTAKKLMCITPISNDLIRDASIVTDEFVRDDLVATTRVKEDSQFIRGVGSQAAPNGILYEVVSGNKFNANGTINVANVIADLQKQMRLVFQANTPGQRYGWIFSSRTFLYLFMLIGADDHWIFQDEMKGGTLLGYPYFWTEQVPSNLGAGSDESEIYFGDFSEAMIADNLMLQVEAFPNAAYDDGTGTIVSGVSNDQSVIRVIERHDFHLRHDASFCVMQVVKWGA